MIFLVFLVPSSVKSIKKCCPAGEVVQLNYLSLDESASPKTFYECLPNSFVVPNNTRELLSDGLSINYSTRSTEFIAFNVLIKEKANWPKCSGDDLLTHSMIQNFENASQTASCVDIMDGRYALITCEKRLQASNNSTEVFKLRKCCSMNFTYNVNTRRCVLNKNSPINRAYKKILDEQIVVFESGIPECNPDEVLVEYYSLVHNLKILRNALSVTNAANSNDTVLIMPPHFCIEVTANSSEELPVGSNHSISMLKASSKWIAKACRPESICDQIPCVRKCCPDGKRIIVSDNKLYCENHDAYLNLKFHNFDTVTFHEKPDPVEPKGI